MLGCGLKKLSPCLVQCQKASAKVANDRRTSRGRCATAQVQTTIDSLRITVASPERTIIPKQKGAEYYLPFWVSSSQADILAAQLQGRPDKSTDPDLFLANINATDSNIKCVTVNLENTTFFAEMLLSQDDKPHKVRCPIGVALALAYRAGAPIVVDEELFDKAGVMLPPYPISTTPKQPWWRRIGNQITFGRVR